MPFGGDYLTITGLGSFAFGTWTDWRDTLQGTDPREAPEDQDAATSDVVQCRVVLTIQTARRQACPRETAAIYGCFESDCAC